MLTTKKRAQIFLIFALGFVSLGGFTGCAPSGARALQQGDELVKKGNYAEAVKKYEEAARELPHNAKVWNALGIGHQHAGDSKKAVQAYQHALDLDINLGAARFNLGSLYLEQRNYPAAIAQFTTFVQLESKNAEGWSKLGLAQMRAAMATSAAAEKNRLFEAALRSLGYSHHLQPSAETANSMGLIQVQRGRPREALSYFASALEKQPDYAAAYLNLAVIYHQTFGDRPVALRNYQRFLKFAKNAPEIPQVQTVVNQLEKELAPPPVVANVPAPAPAPTIAQKTATPVQPVPQPAAPKIETNIAKKVVPETNVARAVVPEPVPQKPAAPIASPKAQAQQSERPPAIQKKAPPVEVTSVPEEPPVKAARDVASASPVSQVPPVAPPSAAVSTNILTNPVPETAALEEDKPGVLNRLNPTSWFKKKPKATTPITELPAAKPAVPEVPVQQSRAEPVPTGSKPAQQAIPRYSYRTQTRFAEGNRDEAIPFFTRGVQAQKDRRWADALAAYRSALNADPAFYEARYNLALVAREAGDLATALGAYEQALIVMPESINARYNFAYALQEAGYFVDSSNELQRLLKQNPNETRAHLLLGNLYAQRLGQVNRARDHYRKVLETDPQHPQALQIRYWMAAHP